MPTARDAGDCNSGGRSKVCRHRVILLLCYSKNKKVTPLQKQTVGDKKIFLAK